MCLLPSHIDSFALMVPQGAALDAILGPVDPTSTQSNSDGLVHTLLSYCVDPKKDVSSRYSRACFSLNRTRHRRHAACDSSILLSRNAHNRTCMYRAECLHYLALCARALVRRGSKEGHFTISTSNFLSQSFSLPHIGLL